MSSSKNSKAIEDFISMTGASEKQANAYLTKNKWNLQNSLNMYYDDGCQPQYVEVQQNNEVQALFKKYGKQKENKLILDDVGLSQLFGVLKINLQNPVIGHIMINIMEMERAEEAEKNHIYNLLKYTRCKCFNEVALKIPQLENQLLKRKDLFKKMYDNFLPFYSSTKSPTLDFDTAEQLWTVYLNGVMPFHGHFIEYLEKLQNKPPKVHKDLWRMMYEFSTNVNSLKDYKEEDGWPLFIDEFVEFLKSKGVQ